MPPMFFCKVFFKDVLYITNSLEVYLISIKTERVRYFEKTCKSVKQSTSLSAIDDWQDEEIVGFEPEEG